MIKARFFLYLGLIQFLTGPAIAYEMGLGVGLRQANVKAKGSGVEANSGNGLVAGVFGYVDIDAPVMIRTGALYTERNFSLETGSVEYDFKVGYLDIPVGAIYMPSENFGFFGGALFGLALADKCEVNVSGQKCKVNKLNSLIYGLELGAHVRPVPNLGLELTYLMASGKVFGNSSFGAENPSGLGVNVLFLF